MRISLSLVRTVWPPSRGRPKIRTHPMSSAPTIYGGVNSHAEYARAYYVEEASGTSLSMKNVSRAVIYALAVPLPPHAEQHRIVAKVDELMAVCDRLETQLTVTQIESRRLLEAVLHEALDDSPKETL
jgi:hypothetical protein